MWIRKYMAGEPGQEGAAPKPTDNQPAPVVAEKKPDVAPVAPVVVAVVAPEKKAEPAPVVRTPEERMQRFDEYEQTLEAKARLIDGKTAAIAAQPAKAPPPKTA